MFPARFAKQVTRASASSQKSTPTAPVGREKGGILDVAVETLLSGLWELKCSSCAVEHPVKSVPRMNRLSSRQIGETLNSLWRISVPRGRLWTLRILLRT